MLLPALAAGQHTLQNSAITAAFSGGRLVALSDGKTSVTVAGDDFEIELDGTTVLSSAESSGPPTLQPGANSSSLALCWGFNGVAIEARYSLVSPGVMFVEKVLRLLPLASSFGTGAVRNITKITLFDKTSLTSGNSSPTSSITASSKYATYGLGDYAVFHRFGTTQGVFFSAQNPYLTLVTANGVTSLSYSPMMLFSANATFEIDAGRCLYLIF
jgi:hypothetical protein